jgi:transcriptional regulator with XRE-family HTH domain
MLLISSIGKQIKERRATLGITQIDLSELAGISPNTLYKIERGQANPSLSILIKIGEVLGMELKMEVKQTSN